MVPIAVFLKMILLTSTRCSIAIAAADGRVVRDSLSRPPRAAAKNHKYTGTGGLTYEQETLMLQQHNEYRRLQNASNMMIMEWNYDLMKLAQDYADQCFYGHSTSSYRKNKGGFEGVGENLYAGTHSFPFNLPTKMWYDEIVDYNYQTTKCATGKVCGHYTQVVWYSSYALGCGVKYCSPFPGTGWDKGYYVVCHYGPAGNYRNKYNFSKGKACSRCDMLKSFKVDAPYCIRGLCSMRPQIGSGSVHSIPHADVIVTSLTALAAIAMTSSLTEAYHI